MRALIVVLNFALIGMYVSVVPAQPELANVTEFESLGLTH